MKTLKHILVLILFFSVLFVIIILPEEPDALWKALPLLLAIFFIFNLVVRRSLSFRGYFTSRYNFLTTKVSKEISFDISRELMFEKVIEVMNQSEFKQVATDKEKYEILAITKMSLTSWGENLYIRFKADGNKTTIHFCSATIFQVYSWGKNEHNLAKLVHDMESSFIV